MSRKRIFKFELTIPASLRLSRRLSKTCNNYQFSTRSVVLHKPSSRRFNCSPQFPTMINPRALYTRPDHPCHSARPIQSELNALFVDDVVVVSSCNVSSGNVPSDGYTHYASCFSITSQLASLPRSISQLFSPLQPCCSLSWPAQAATQLQKTLADHVLRITPLQHLHMFTPETFSSPFLCATLTRFHTSLNQQHKSFHDSLNQTAFCA